jgi:CRISPR/Cas system endoribonuclease Cas6 (RAMP superfamily)
MLRALEEAAARGIGRTRLRLEAARERVDLGSRTLPAGPVEVELLTPLRLRAGGQLVSPERFSPTLFVQALFRRLSLLAACWGEPPAPLPFEPVRERLLRLAGTVEGVRWVEQQRRSYRQHTRMRMGGLVGSFRLDLEADDPLAPLLRAGEQLHVGKVTTMGLGRYRLNLAGQPAHAA